MPTDTILSYVITGSLGLLLTIVGTKITYNDLKDTITHKKKTNIINHRPQLPFFTSFGPCHFQHF